MQMLHRSSRLALVALTALVTLGASVAAQTSGRTPISSLPFVITASGSYYLSQNLTAANTEGIRVHASNVTIDLNGFSLRGNNSAANGIYAITQFEDLTITNGTIVGWGLDGLTLGNMSRTVLRQVRVLDNGGMGVRVGPRSVVEDCVVGGNGAGGIKTEAESVVRGCHIEGPNGTLVQVSVWSRVERSTLLSGTLGADLGGDCVLEGCTIRGSGTRVRARTRCTIRELQIVGGTIAIDVTEPFCVITDNHISGSTTGVRVTGSRALVIRNSFASNSVNVSATSTSMVGPIVTSANFATNTNPNANFQL